jgi:KDO2-lipid IV(A) lauroyltransferase
MSPSFRQLPDAAGGVLIDVLAFFIPHIPIPVLYAGMDIMLILFYPVLWLFPKTKRNLFTNLEIVFGDRLSTREKRALARRVVRNFANIPVISVYYVHPRNLPKIRDDVTFVGLEHLKGALVEGKGIIGLGAHIGNFILMSMAFARTELPFVVVTRDPPEMSLRTRYRRLKKACGLTWIDYGGGAAATKGILRALKDNHIVHLISDERNRHGIIVPFLGREALTPAGPAVLSLRTGAPIVPIFIHEHARFRHTVEIQPPLTVDLTGDHQRDIYLLTEKANEAIGDFIRNHPDQWTWINKRWKL